MPCTEDTDQLLRRVELGDKSASEQLMAKHRDRLLRMISIRMDPRLTTRVDPSDVVQDVLATAVVRLPEYANARPLPFYPWLRQLAWDRLVELHQHHIRTQKRTVDKEEHLAMELSNESIYQLAHKFQLNRSTPSVKAMREEIHQRARDALERLPESDREILVMRHLEQMKIGEIAALLGLTDGAVKMRRLRALERLRQLLGAETSEA